MDAPAAKRNQNEELLHFVGYGNGEISLSRSGEAPFTLKVGSCTRLSGFGKNNEGLPNNLIKKGTVLKVQWSDNSVTRVSKTLSTQNHAVNRWVAANPNYSKYQKGVPTLEHLLVQASRDYEEHEVDEPTGQDDIVTKLLEGRVEATAEKSVAEHRAFVLLAALSNYGGHRRATLF